MIDNIDKQLNTADSRGLSEVIILNHITLKLYKEVSDLNCNILSYVYTTYTTETIECTLIFGNEA